MPKVASIQLVSRTMPVFELIRSPKVPKPCRWLRWKDQVYSGVCRCVRISLNTKRKFRSTNSLVLFIYLKRYENWSPADYLGLIGGDAGWRAIWTEYWGCMPALLRFRWSTSLLWGWIVLKGGTCAVCVQERADLPGTRIREAAPSMPATRDRTHQVL